MFTKVTKVIFCLIIMLQIMGSTTLFAENNQQKQSQLTKKITRANEDLTHSKANSKQLRKKVIEAEDKLNVISRQLHNTEQKINHLTTKLSKSNATKKKLLKQTYQQKHALAQQLLALYTSGKQSHLRLLLKQDDPSDISRTIKYYEYLNKHRLKRIHSIDKQLEKIEKIQAQINADKKVLHTLQEQQGTKKKALKKAVITKEKALKKQSRIVISNTQKLSRLRNEEQNLLNIIEKLALKEKRERLKREKEEKKRQLASIKAKKEAQALAIKKAEKKLINNKVKISKAPKKEKVTRHFVSDKPFSNLKGKLSWPVRGSLLHKFNQTRNSKQKWKAVVISASGGARVHAVARGKVEYSGRFKGYGYVVIIRHDKNYRSIYGYNRSVYKKAGDIVKAGEVIASVGNSGSIKQNALYFEIRKKTSQQNPAKWCR